MKLARYCLPLFLALTCTYLAARSNPVPLLYQVTPSSGKPGHAQFNLQIHGTGFVRGAVAQWNGTPLTTRFISQSIVSATIPASNLAKAGTASVTVANPGGIASNIVYFPIRHGSSTVALTADPASIEFGAPAVGDFSKNGVQDIAMFGSDSNTQDVYFDTYVGNGHGNFRKVPGVLGNYPNFLCGPNISADFNNDGILDVAACVNNGDGNDSPYYLIYLGDGHGGFTAAPSSSLFSGVGAVADMNGDGILDFVTMSYSEYPPALGVYLGNGDGTFTLIPSNIGPYATGTPIIGDFNGDGKLDVAIPGANVVSVFLGNGDGTLQSEVDYPISGGNHNGSEYSGAAVDLNGDGELDIVTNNVSVMQGNGDGTFANTFSIPVNGALEGELKVGDLNGDGKLDLATVIESESNQTTLDVLLGNGDGTFGSPLAFVVSNSIFGYAPTGMADFNNDGGLDFVVGGSPLATFVMLQTPAK